MPICYVNSYGLEPLLKDSFTFTIDINSLTFQSRGCSNSSRIGPDRIVFYFVNRPSLVSTGTCFDSAHFGPAGFHGHAPYSRCRTIVHNSLPCFCDVVATRGLSFSDD